MALTEQELRSLDYEPDTGGHFGDYGGRYVSETLMAALSQLDQNYQKLKNDPDFTVIGHITDESSGANFIAKDGTIQELVAQGWNAI